MGTNLVTAIAPAAGIARFAGSTQSLTSSALTSGEISTAGGTLTIGSGTINLGSITVASAACSSAQTATVIGTASTDNVMVDFNGDPTGVVGFQPSTSGMLTLIKYPTSNTVNVKVCNNTAGSITTGSVTVNVRVVR